MIAVLGLAALAFCGETKTAPIPPLYLRVGQRYPLEGLIPQSAKIQPDGIVKVHQTPEGVLLVAQKQGSALLTLETEGKQISVKIIVRPDSPRNPVSESLGDASKELKSIPGARLEVLGGKMIIRGEVLGRTAYQRLLLYLKSFPKNLVALALAGPGIKDSIIEQALSSLKARGIEQARILNAGHRFFLEGWVSTPEDVEQAFEVVQAIIPNIENHLAIPIRINPTITVRVYILELSRQAHQALGLSWPTMVHQIGTLSQQGFFFNPSWTANLQHLAANGQARILAEPLLAVKSGSSAELSAGGEIPIRVTGRYENKVVWKHYGLKIHLHIAGTAGRHIRTKIETESSQLDGANAVDGVPGLRTNRMSTEVDALENQPILLTGLFQSTASKDVDKLPILGHLPLIGELFKSRRFRDHESELLVALIPSYGPTETRLPLESAHGLELDFKWRLLD